MNSDEYILINENENNEFLFKIHDFQFDNYKTFSIKNKLNVTLKKHPNGISIQSFKKYINTSPVNEQNNKKISFSGTIVSVRFIYILLTVGFVIYIAYAIVVYKLLAPHMEAFQILFRAKSPLLMIVISLPLLVVFFVIMYYLFQQFILRKELITADWSDANVLTLNNSRNYIFRRADIKTTFFFINRITHLSKWLVIEKKNGVRYIILCKSEDNNAYQKFIDLYIENFDINIEKTYTTIGSSNSRLMKKKYTHE